MKKIQLFFAIICLCFLTSATLHNQYEVVMKEAIEKLYQAQSPEALQEASNTFERIARKETDKWHPHYYAAYAQIMMCLQSKDGVQQDQYLDTALEMIEAAKALSPGNSELLALEGFAYMMRIPIDPATRGAQYSGMSMGALQQAIAINPENPRAFFILADMQYGTAQFMGSDSSVACISLDKAIELFQSFQPADELAPTWGEKWAMHSKEQKGCE